jgi:flagellar basal-body rod modification protein FlgD
MSTVSNAASVFSPSQINTTSSSSSSSTSSTAQAAGANASQQLAGNFNTFVQLLTTQLQNQNPLDTNQFTQQLVEFASVEQQIDMNTNLQSLITMQQTTEATSALQLVGSTITVGGNSATLSNATSTPATWSLTTSTPANATVTVTNSSGSTAYSGTLSLNAGTQSFTWNGQGSNGQTWPDGVYTLSVKATGANGQAVTVSTQVQGVVSGVNLNSNPPTLKVNGQNVQISQVTAISQ